MTLEIKPIGLEEICSFINAGPFVFSRWGDGEWSAILGEGHQNCDGQIYTDKLRSDLGQALVDMEKVLIEHHMVGMQSLALRRFGPQIETWLDNHDICLEWVDSGVFHTASIRDQLGPLLDILRDRTVVFVGPEYLSELSWLLPVKLHILVKETCCYDDIEMIKETAHSLAMRSYIDFRDNALFAISAGPAAKILIQYLATHFPEGTFIDFGSLWEPYAGGRVNRTYHQKIVERVTRQMAG